MNPTDTIVACATGPGHSVRGLIRISGPESLAGCGSVLGVISRRRGASTINIRIGPDRRLPALAIHSPGPRSYTGEDTIELLVPGNPILIDRIICGLCAVPGVRRAQPGEFSARAYLSGKLTLEQSEGIAAMIAARTEAELEGARQLKSGAFGRACEPLVDECATLLALVEAGIDFTDQEDVSAIAPADLLHRMAHLNERIAGLLGAADAAEVESGLPRVVLIGPPNAGKSTLFNALLGRSRAVTSGMAGTTRDVLAEEISLAGASGTVEVVLQDSPGIDARTISSEADRAAQRAAVAAVADADVVLWCDPEGRRDLRLAGLEADALNAVQVLRVRTFGDRLAPTADPAFVPVCALDGWNLETLKQKMADSVGRARHGAAAAILPRHRAALRSGFEHIAAAGAWAEADRGGRVLSQPELIARALREALDSLGELAGRISPDDVLGRIFSTFCVGK